MGHVVGWYLGLALVEGFESLVHLAFLYEVGDEVGKPASVCVAHAHGCLVDVEAGVLEVAV